MLNVISEIVVALINNQKIATTGDTDQNIAEVCKAIDEISKQIQISRG